MSKVDYEKYNHRYHYSAGNEHTRTRPGYYRPPHYERDVERDEQPFAYDNESDYYEAHPAFDRKKRLGRHRDKNFLQEIGHNMKQAWDEWAKDDTRVDNPLREDTYYPNDYNYDGRYENYRSHEQRTPPQRIYVDDYDEHDSYVHWPRRRYIMDENYNLDEENYFRDDEFDSPQFSGNDRHMGMRRRSREKQGKHLFKYGTRR